jgi:hypothetical protein
MSKQACQHHVFPEDGCLVCELEAKVRHLERVLALVRAVHPTPVHIAEVVIADAERGEKKS